MSFNQKTYYPKEDDDDQTRFFAWTQAQAGPAANRLDDNLQKYSDNPNVDGRYSEGFRSHNYDQPYQHIAAPIPSISTLSTEPVTTYQFVTPDTPNPTDLVPTWPNTPSPTSLIATQPNTPIVVWKTCFL